MKNSEKIKKILVDMASNDQLPMDMNALDASVFAFADTPDALAAELETLRNSCLEGLDGSWDPSGEGAEGFQAMADSAEKIAAQLNLTLPEYEAELGE